VTIWVTPSDTPEKLPNIPKDRLLRGFSARVFEEREQTEFELSPYGDRIPTAFLQAGGIRMRGKVKPLGKCPKCKKAFQPILLGGAKLIAYGCKRCETLPTRFYISIYVREKGTVKIYSGSDGYPLDSFDRALRLLQHINWEIDNHRFDATRYVKGDLRDYQFDRVIESWLEKQSKRAERKELNSEYVADMRRNAKSFFLPFFGRLDVREIRTKDIEAFHELLRERTNSEKYRKNIMGVLHKIFSDLKHEEIIPKIPSFPRIQIQAPTPRWINYETQLTILGQIPEKHRPIFNFLIHHGVRPCEARGLKMDCLNLRDGTVEIKRSKSTSGEPREFTKVKRAWTIPIHGEVLPDLERISQERISGYVFTVQGNPYSKQRLSKIWKKACEDVGSSGVTLYQGTRHSFASQAMIRGVEQIMIQKFLGHTDPRTTARYEHAKAHELASVQPVIVRQFTKRKALNK